MSAHSLKMPSMTSVVTGWVSVVVVWTGTAYTITGPMTDGRHVAGAVLGIVLDVVLVIQEVHRFRIRERAKRARAMSDFRAENRPLWVTARYTGTWRSDVSGEVLTVRWDRVTRQYLVSGWLSDHWQITNETPWGDLESLSSTVLELERSGEMTPVDDEGTCNVRARLRLPGWEESIVLKRQVTEPIAMARVRKHRQPES